MFNNVALDVFIGLVFIFLLYSLLATIIQEMIATRLAFRAKVLEKAIVRMLEDGKTTTILPYGDRINEILHLFGLKSLLKGKTVAPWFYAHPLIKYLAEDNYYSKPAYLDASNFSKVMIDLLKGFGQPESQTVQSIHNSITAGIIHKLPINILTDDADKANPAIKVLRTQNPNLPNSATIGSETVSINTNTALFLRSLWQDSGADLNTFKLKLEQWFDDTMQRATGWYKRYTRIVLFIIGIIVAYVFNIDTIAIHRILSKDKGARDQLVTMAIHDQGKLKNDVETIGQMDTETTDSILKNTYHMVTNDVESASNILGLGRPWTDSCKVCDSIYGSKESNLTFVKRLDSFNREKFIIDSLRKLSDNNKKDIALIDSLIKNADTTKIKQLKLETGLKDSIYKANDSRLKLHNPAGLKELEKMIVLSVRCPYIIQQSKTWFKYSPNQSGGLETLLGWLITALAITLGAPFWFDLLSKLISLRGTGAKIVASDTDTKKTVTPPTTNPVTINVNSNPGEEAVG